MGKDEEEDVGASVVKVGREVGERWRVVKA